jgi:hypothetical protein
LAINRLSGRLHKNEIRDSYRLLFAGRNIYTLGSWIVKEKAGEQAVQADRVPQ